MIIFLVLLPIVKNKILNYKRVKKIKKLEEKRKSRVITMIHRQEIISIIGIPFTRYINIEDSEEILRAIRTTDKNKAIDLLLHTPGGLVLAAEQIARAIKKHPSPVRVIVPHYAMSGGTIIALAADEILIDKNAVLGPVDPQIGNYPAVSILKTKNSKNINDIDDKTLILSDMAEKAVIQLKNFLYLLLQDKMKEDQIETLIDYLATGRFTHDFPLTIDVLKELEINFKTNLPEEIYDLMRLYPQPGKGRPSVYYVRN
ncbi:MAG: SDH family Clp fold serine proteinase [bacterium]